MGRAWRHRAWRHRVDDITVVKIVTWATVSSSGWQTCIGVIRGFQFVAWYRYFLTQKKAQDKKLEVSEMRMLRWMCGVIELVGMRNDRIRGNNSWANRKESPWKKVEVVWPCHANEGTLCRKEGKWQCRGREELRYKRRRLDSVRYDINEKGLSAEEVSTTVLHGCVYRQTSTPHKSGNKMKRTNVRAHENFPQSVFRQQRSYREEWRNVRKYYKGINSASCCMQIIQVCWQRQITEKNEPSGVANDPLKVRFLYVSLRWDVCIVVVVTLY